MYALFVFLGVESVFLTCMLFCRLIGWVSNIISDYKANTLVFIVEDNPIGIYLCILKSILYSFPFRLLRNIPYGMSFKSVS